MKPCPECGKALEPDPEWEYCPFCGTTLNWRSDVADWRWIATYETLGEGAYIADELKRRGIKTRLREESGSRPPYFIAHTEYVLDVAADAFEAAAEAIAAIAKRDKIEEEPSEDDDVPPSQSLSRQIAFNYGLVLVLILAFGMLLGLLAGLASLFDRDPFTR